MHNIIYRIWPEDEISEDWDLGLISSLQKEANQQEGDNYRGTTLMNITYKLLSDFLY